MNNTIEAEVVQAAPSMALTRVEPMAVGQAMAVDDIIAQVQLIQNVMHKVMKEGEHFGTIPGCGDKKTLLQPGAQKLTMTFRLCPSYEIQEVNIERGHKEYRVICSLKSASGSFVGQGVGCCSTMESKYRFRGGARKCPSCGKETIIKGKAEYGGGWLCFGKKGGCGAKWEDGAKVIEAQSVEKVENDNPADHFNTVLKMAKKRAFVDATITATAASDIFTQDIGDDEGDDQPRPTPPAPPKARQTPQDAPRAVHTPPTARSSPQNPPANAQMANPASSPAEKRAKAVKMAEDAGLGQYLGEYLEAAAMIMPGEQVSDWPAQWLPATKAEAEALIAALKAFSEGAEATRPYAPHVVETVPGTNATPGLRTKPIEVPRDKPNAAEAGQSAPDEWFMKVLVPIPRKGQKRDEYLKNPDTIGSLFEQRHGKDEESTASRQRLWGFLEHYEPKGWEKRDGTQMPPGEADLNFRKALDALGEYLEKRGEKL